MLQEAKIIRHKNSGQYLEHLAHFYTEMKTRIHPKKKSSIRLTFMLLMVNVLIRRSNMVYQDGLRNVNSMIFNSQVDLLLKLPSGKNQHTSLSNESQ